MSGFGNRNLHGLSWSLGGLYYQFITTGPEVTTYTSKSGVSVFKGSAVLVSLPKEPTSSDIKATATGSTLEEISGDPPIPPQESTQLISKVKNIVQSQLIPEPVYYGFKELPTDDQKLSYTQLLYSWSGVPGRIYNAGVYMLAPAFHPSDICYDASPTKITGTTAESRMPDADWPHDACILTVDSTEYGSRKFIVMVDASSKFYCWPTIYDNAATEYLYPEDSPYISQSIKTNVSNDQVVSVTPPFPEWVYVPKDNRRDTDEFSDINSGEPRYVWRFHPQGTKVVGIVLQRTTMESTPIYGRVANYQTLIPYEEVDTGFFLEIDTKQRATRAVLDYEGPLKNDLPGYVEFSINIAITGANKEDFIFSMTLRREQQASSTRYPIAAAYLSPIKNGWSSRNTKVSSGDLIVMDIKSYIDDRAQLWIDRECGYKGTTAEKVRQTWLIVSNEETKTEVMTFLTKDQPTDFRTKQYYLTTEPLYAIYGVLKHIDLTTLSFVYEVRRKKYSIDENSYSTVIGHTIDTRYNDFKVRQRWEQENLGIRYYVFGEKVKEYTAGSDLSVWDSVDETELFDDPIQFSPLTVGTKWLYSRSIVDGSAFPDKHWLAQYIKCQSKYGLVNTYFDYTDLNNSSGIIEDAEGIKNRLLQYCSQLTDNSGTNKETYYSSKIGMTYTSIYGDGYSSNQTDFPYTLSLGCQTVDESYVDNILVPWVSEIYNNFMEHNQITSRSHIYMYWNLMAYGDVLPEEADWVVTYKNLWGIYRLPGSTLTSAIPVSGYRKCDSCNYNQEDIESYIMSLPIGYNFSTPYEHYNFDLLTLLARDYNYVYAIEDYYRTNIYNNDLNNPNLRVYNYSIGAEWMMREWNQAVDLDANFSLAVNLQGYYAGSIVSPVITGMVPNVTLFSTYEYSSGSSDYLDLYNEPHMNTYPYNYAHDEEVNVPLLHFTFADGTFSYDNEPTINDYDFLTVDIISHVDATWEKTHKYFYEHVYNHALSIPEPTISIIVDNYVYLPKKTIVYHDGSIMLNLFDPELSFYEPRCNGSMLFFG